MMSILSTLTWALLVTAALSQEGTCSAGSGVYKFNLTRWEGYVVNDGQLGILSGFFTVPDFIVQRYFSYFYGDMPIAGYQNVVVLKNQNDVVIFDSGSGPGAPLGGTSGKLFPGLKAVGIAPEDVTKVFLTHAHVDHAAGLITATGGAAFPNAMVYLHVDEDKFWRMSPADIKKTYPLLPQFITDGTPPLYMSVRNAYAGKIRLLNDLEDTGGIKAMHVPGHTPGHTIYRIDNEFVVTADSLITRTTAIQNPDWNILSDANRTQAIASRIKLMENLSKEQIRTQLYHDFFPGIGFITQDKAAFDFNAIAVAM